MQLLTAGWENVCHGEICFCVSALGCALQSLLLGADDENALLFLYICNKKVKIFVRTTHFPDFVATFFHKTFKLMIRNTPRA
jgi:hypothetical protein